MSAVRVTGSAGLIGAESVRFFAAQVFAAQVFAAQVFAARVFAAQGFDIVGIANGMRRVFFGRDASTAWSRQRLAIEVKSYQQHDGDIRYRLLINSIFARYGKAITAVVHGAAQPSHDWAAGDPQTDFAVNANGTLNLPEATRQNCPEAVSIFTSTDKVYGDAPNTLPLRQRRYSARTHRGSHLEAPIGERLDADRDVRSLG